jgi:hypothetical protein
MLRVGRLAAPGDSLASTEVGALGYYFRGKVLDSCALVRPEALPFLPLTPDGALHPGFVKATNPTWVASLEASANGARELLIYSRKLTSP